MPKTLPLEEKQAFEGFRFVYKGKRYRAKATPNSACKGCAFDNDTLGCNQVPHCVGTKQELIFVPVGKKKGKRNENKEQEVKETKSKGNVRKYELQKGVQYPPEK